MSKIPQGAWSAIAARYQNGESISAIARSYDCTPPAIHYILKRNRQRPPDALRPPVQKQQAAAAAAPIGASNPGPVSPPVSPAARSEPDPSQRLVRGTAPIATTASGQLAKEPDQRPVTP